MIWHPADTKAWCVCPHFLLSRKTKYCRTFVGHLTLLPELHILRLEVSSVSCGLVRILNMVTNMLLLVLFVSDFLPHLVEGTCSKALYITTPKQMEALRGSCLLIPCNFSAVSDSSDKGFSSSREIFGVWIKEEPAFSQKPKNVIFHSDRTINRYPMSITGNLRQRICTTLFSSLEKSHTDKYFFRIESSPFLATAACDPLQITVKDSPPSPTIEISGDLKEAESVTVTCSAPAPCPQSPPKLTWTLPENPPNTMEENPDRTLTTKIQKTLTLTDQHDGFNITCSASYPVNKGKDVKTAETKTVHVSYAPKDTSASVSRPSGFVPASSLVELSCSSRAQPPISSFTWFKESQDGDIKVSQGEIYSFNATEGGRYYCVATNELGKETSPKIHLANGGAEQLDGSSPWGGVVGGIIGIMILICLAVAVWWLKSKHTTQEQSQGEQIRGEHETQINDTQRLTAVQESAAATETGEEIHYGEIDFSKHRYQSPPVSEQDGGQTEDTLYAQVKVSETANRPEDLYAQVKRK
ncbi:sialic acid-binding Ig-like lectin 12 [Gymnodraco acuticeps]|uniref:Sialic acid-binding Ig-like lectin 12 n=1 Tax=Gymnodraco acuticeps TaxID=8218 RepID=A0A6P8TUI1_GYMAC|nr:sialic acid-binding Ig-like lectin 12 [Gymnodraco acuticeps]